MEAQGTTGTAGSSLTERRIDAYTACIGFDEFDPPQTTGGERGFALQLRCDVTLYVSAGRGRRTLEREWAGDGDAICLAVPDDEDGIRDALRGMLRLIRPLQDLGLTDGEWESILPVDVVPWIADPEERACHAAATVSMSVIRLVRFDAARVLMTVCKDVGDNGGAAGGGDAETECSVCLVALSEREAVEMPGCVHAFHRRCISKWFRRKATCPLCRDDVVKYLADPELQQHFAEFDEI